MLTIYKASAGSGKTFTLAFEYIKTLLGIKLQRGGYVLNDAKYVPGGRRMPRRHAAILAITFTNAATEEMKSRIIRQLSTLSDPAKIGTTPYTSMLCKCFGCTADELGKAAQLALTELLYDYNAFNVSTIDSFFQAVLRTFSREIDRQGDYELSLERKDMIFQAISLMLDELNTGADTGGKRLNRWVRNYVRSRITEGGEYNFFNRNGRILSNLAADVDKSMDETFVDNVKALDRYLESPERLDSFCAELTRRIDDAYAAAVAAARRLIAFRDSNGLPENYLSKIASRIEMAFDPASKYKSNALAIAFFKKDPADLELKGDCLTVANFKATPEALRDDALTLFRDFAVQFPPCEQRRKMYRELLSAAGLLEFIGETRHKLRELMKENNMMLISDTGELLSGIISDAEMPFIYERLGMTLESLLIDEFQDTSRLQWRNLKPLVSNSLAYDYDNLIIGDVKQSIYRFRNSDSELLGSVVQTVDFPDRCVGRGSRPEENTNHRSAGDIVRFNNEIFERLAKDLAVNHYEAVRQTVDEKLDKVPAYIKLNFHDGDNDGMETLVLEEMAQDILRQHETGYAWRDIMVLARLGDEATRIVRYLIEVHPEIRVLSSEALLLSNSPAVRTIISSLKLVARSYEGKKSTRCDDAPQYASRSDIIMMITRFNYFASQGYDTLSSLRMAMEEDSSMSDHIRSEVDVIRSKNPANLVALIETIVALRLSPQQRISEYAYIAALQDLAVKHLESPNPSLSAFLDAYSRNEQKWAILTPSSLDAVEVMTIHKSKGLERACVHIPFGNWKLRGRNRKMWIRMDGFTGFTPGIVPPVCRVNVDAASPFADRNLSPVADEVERECRAEIMDCLNTAYVAFTRASRELIIHCDKSSPGIGTYVFSAFTGIYDAATLPFVRAEGEGIGTCYLLGAPTIPLKKEENTVGTVDSGEYKVFFRDDTRELVSIDDIFASDDDLGDEDDKEIVDKAEPFAGTAAMKEASRRGTNLHAILAAMRTADDLDDAVDRLCSRLDIPAAEREEYRRDLRHAFEVAGDTAAEWFAPENIVYPERSFFDPHTGKTSRPDRIVIRPDGRGVIVDYKFTTESRNRHLRQVSDYRRLLTSTGCANVDVYLWYPLLEEIIKV